MRQRSSVALMLAAFLLDLAACTGSDVSDGQAADGKSTTSTSVSLSPTTTEPAPPTTEPEPPPRANMAELEILWAEQRQVMIDRIKADGFGRGPDGSITGAGGFTIDTSTCQVGWPDTEGIGDSIVIGRTSPQSGGLGLSEGAAGLLAYFAYVNANGGIAGKPIELVAKDDGYQADVTVQLVDEFLEDVKPFAVWTLGTTPSAAVYDKLNDL